MQHNAKMLVVFWDYIKYRNITIDWNIT